MLYVQEHAENMEFNLSHASEFFYVNLRHACCLYLSSGTGTNLKVGAAKRGKIVFFLVVPLHFFWL